MLQTYAFLSNITLIRHIKVECYG